MAKRKKTAKLPYGPDGINIHCMPLWMFMGLISDDLWEPYENQVELSKMHNDKYDIHDGWIVKAYQNKDLNFEVTRLCRIPDGLKVARLYIRTMEGGTIHGLWIGKADVIDRLLENNRTIHRLQEESFAEACTLPNTGFYDEFDRTTFEIDHMKYRSHAETF